MKNRRTPIGVTLRLFIAAAWLQGAAALAGTAYFDSVVVSNRLDQDNASATNVFAGEVVMGRGLIVSSTLAVARQGDVSMGPYTNGAPASGMSGALPPGYPGALMVFDGSQWIAATNVSLDFLLAVASLAESASQTASNAATAPYAAAISNLAQSAYDAATLYNVTNTMVVASTSSVPTTAAVSNYVEEVTGDSWSAPSILPSEATVTISRTSKRYLRLTLTNNATVTFDSTGWETSGVGRVSLELYTGPHAVTFDTNAISGSASLSLVTNAFNGLLFRKTLMESKWVVRQ